MRWRELIRISCGRAGVLAVVVGMYWIWWDSFHEVGRFFMQVPLPFTFVLSRFSSISCFFKPAGIALGCVLVYLFLRKNARVLMTPHLPIVLFCVEIGFHVIYYASVSIGNLAIACVMYAAISVCVVLNILIIALQVHSFERREVIFIAMGSIVCYGVCNNLVFPVFLLTVPLPGIGVFYLTALIIGFMCSRTFSQQAASPIEPHRVIRVKTPLPLIVHLLVYGLAFGILHILGGLIARGRYSTNIAVFFACMLTIGCLAGLFLRKKSNQEIWSKIRSTVFPLSVIGYLLIPLVSNSDAALALTEAGNLLYNAIFFIGCLTLMQKTYVDPRTIIVKGLFYKNVGTLVGVLWARMYDGVLMDSTTHSLLSVAIVLLLTVATFWVGSDEQIRKIWGLRKNLSPKQYNDRLNEIKCSKLTKTHHLTTRESEILLLFVQGMRAAEIEEALCVSIDTVRSHTKHLYAKLDVHSLKELRKLVKSVDVDEVEVSECAMDLEYEKSARERS